VLILEVHNPLAVRRTVSFAQAVIDGAAVVEGVRAVRIMTQDEMFQQWKLDNIPVMVDPSGSVLSALQPGVLVDATLAKRNIGMQRGMAPLTIALGPGFKAGGDVDVVVETNRGHTLGRLIFEGYAEPDTGVPAPIGGYDRERVLRAPCCSTVKHVLDISDPVQEGDVICFVGEQPVHAPFDGMVRGLIMNGCEVTPGMKIGDVDPRSNKEMCYTISDRARSIGRAVLEAIVYLQQRKQRS
jgi:xanthine dehydrogenase accessory factor